MTSEIKVGDLIKSRDIKGHNDTHDAYFKQYEDHGWLQLHRKPFHSLHESPPTLMQMGVLIDMASLFPGAKVLDYGCGTGWLARSLGYLGCVVEGIDVSEKAITAGSEMIASDQLSIGATVNLSVTDGVSLPFPNEHFDRIVCFSAFHHVADQEATLREMHRVLRKGGVAVFNEPGPHHSLDPGSQLEMAQFNVIENDIVIEDIDHLAKQIGYHAAKLAYFAAFPLIIDIPTYKKLLSSDRSTPAVSDASQFVASTLANIRIFSLEKVGTPDSRDASRVGGKIKIVDIINHQEGELVTLRWENVGEAMWLPPLPEKTGSVSIGVRVEEGGKLRDVERILLSETPIQPGTKGTTTVVISPEITSRGKVHIGLVSEHVAWFSDVELVH